MPTSSLMSKPRLLQLTSTNHLDPETVLPQDAIVMPGTEIYYFRKPLVQHSVKYGSVEDLFFTPPPPSFETGKVSHVIAP